MAKEAEKSGESSGKQKNERTGSTRSKSGAKTGTRETSSKTKGQSQEAGMASQSGNEKDDARAAIGEFQSQRREEMQGILDKRSDESANPPEIVREFAAAWLPRHLAEAEVLVPAFENAGVDEDKMVAVKIRKDILNMLLADLLESGADEHAEPKLEALADAFEGVAEAAKQELESLADADGTDLSDLRARLDACFEEAKAEFEDVEENFREAMDLLAPRTLSVASMRWQGRSGGRRFEDERLSAGRSGDRERGYRRRDEDEGYRRIGRDEVERYGHREDRGRGQAGGFGDPEDRWRAAGREWLGSGPRSSRREDDEGYGRARVRDAGDGDRGYGRQRRGDGYSGGYERRPGGGAHESGRQAGDYGGYAGYEGRREGGRYEEDEQRRRYRGGGRYEDEDERGPRARSGGGWSGDPEGHSEAARKGWERRR